MKWCKTLYAVQAVKKNIWILGITSMQCCPCRVEEDNILEFREEEVREAAHKKLWTQVISFVANNTRSHFFVVKPEKIILFTR